MIIIQNDSGLLSAADVSGLEAEAGRWPFELHVLARSVPNKAAMADAVHRCVTTPNVVCIGIDAQHHFTETHFGTATGVRPVDFNQIAAAGNSSFRSGSWRGGIEAIADRAVEASRATTAAGVAPTIVVQPQVTAPAPSHSGWWVLGGGSILLAGVALWFVWRSRKKQREFEAKMDQDMSSFREEASEYRARNVEESAWHEKMRETVEHPRRARVTLAPATIAAPATQTVVVNQPAPSGTEGLVAGYVLGRLDQPAAHTTVIEREVYREPVHQSSFSSSSSDDSDGSSSSFDWGSSSSSDSGGSSFDWGSGGSDIGGGGSDFGGGGSDW